MDKIFPNYCSSGEITACSLHRSSEAAVAASLPEYALAGRRSGCDSVAVIIFARFRRGLISQVAQTAEARHHRKPRVLSCRFNDLLLARGPINEALLLKQEDDILKVPLPSAVVLQDYHPLGCYYAKPVWEFNRVFQGRAIVTSDSRRCVQSNRPGLCTC